MTAIVVLDCVFVYRLQIHPTLIHLFSEGLARIRRRKSMVVTLPGFVKSYPHPNIKQTE